MSHRHRAYPNPDHSGLQPLTVEEAYSNLVTSLDRIVADYPSAISSRHALSGFYYGPTSLSFLFLALSGLFPDLTVNSKSLRYWSKAYLEVSLSYKQHNPDPNDCGVANEKLTTLALTAALDQDKSAAERLCSYVPKLLNTRSREGSCEWLYGLSGFLYLLRLCRSHLPQTSHIVEPAIQEITSYILRQPLPWKWHEKEYLGAVHGTIGIITQIVLSSPLPEILQQLSPLLSNLLATQLTSGNFPPSTSSSRNDVLVQFCHGAPGFLTSFHSLMPYFPELKSQLTATIQRGEKCVIERGVLRKTLSLCHGVYGNALALQNSDMRRLLKLTCDGVLQWDQDDDVDERFGLFTGEAGRCWAMAMIVKGIEGKILGYNDL